ncbi:hypothetical protein BpHYR1_048317 [Brachionus plicatilis]|uniref:Uncharacterized protein n=1 Tax=Brachionus plicatilis TaxID=10195 RepID=A0A3M7QNP1_BRAPC|nr:hypothetical protein BpHYR1_048317 [Brachionus plicatilis]
MSYAKFKFMNTHPHLSKSLVPFIRRVFLIKRLCSIPASHYCDKPLTILFTNPRERIFRIICELWFTRSIIYFFYSESISSLQINK